MWTLDEIKRAYGYGRRLSKDTYPHWLISRIEELEKENEFLRLQNESLENKLQHYRD